MRERAQPAAIWACMGIANRIAERMGLHRDGAALGLSVLRSEERRRIWWQLQFMEIPMGMRLGTISLGLYADWDTKLPSNLEDSDVKSGMTALPPAREGLTSVSHCLWRYEILHQQREMRQENGRIDGIAWLLSPEVPIATKDSRINGLERVLAEKFLQYCEPLDPLHLYIQIGIRSFILAGRRTVRTPSLLDAKLSAMSMQQRDDFLSLSKKILEYYLLSHTTESLNRFRWNFDNDFQWPAC
jgi:hypothetical protein